MPAIARVIAAAAENALDGLKFASQDAPALITLCASSATAGEDLSFGVGSETFLEAAEINLEIGDQVVSRDRDVLLEQEVVPPGQYFLRVPVVAADMSFLLIIEPVT